MSNIVVPELGESVVEARISRWLKKAGDRVEVGEPVVHLETEKVDLEVNADKPGVIASIARKEGDDVKIGEVLGVIDESGGTATATPPSGNGSKKSAAAPVPAPAPTAESRIAPTSDTRIAPTTDSRIAPTSDSRIAPASEATIAPTVESRIAPTRVRSPGDRSEERVRMSKRRQTIARRLVEAQHAAAMLTTFNEVDMSAVMALRERQKESFKKGFGVGLGIASFFVKASIAALRSFPALNAEIQGDEILYKHYYDIGMAVGAEGGLVVPVLRDADRMTFPQVEIAIRDYAAKAKDGTLTLEDLRGGTFTITNGGVFGSLMSTPILNPPQVGILGLHKIQDRVVPVNGQPAIRPMMYIALSYDHRIVDGREAVQFLVRIRHYIEDPGNLLLEG
ncbi:MAG TPA: 2-oxoglutarate dehydrogenase complex dihydrolipoyllysine-residue succinyltransferase [Vicinamibacterales bacterium]|jgi:2-oxoglutarate dehydrogenase E2 component (dihydrolipoamide succinyltransferase)